MNLIIKRHPTDDSYLEFFIVVGDALWYLWTVHEDNLYECDLFLDPVKDDIEEHGEAHVKMVHFERMKDVHIGNRS